MKHQTLLKHSHVQYQQHNDIILCTTSAQSTKSGTSNLQHYTQPPQTRLNHLLPYPSHTTISVYAGLHEGQTLLRIRLHQHKNDHIWQTRYTSIMGFIWITWMLSRLCAIALSLLFVIECGQSLHEVLTRLTRWLKARNHEFHVDHTVVPDLFYAARNKTVIKIELLGK